MINMIDLFMISSDLISNYITWLLKNNYSYFVQSDTFLLSVIVLQYRVLCKSNWNKYRSFLQKTKIVNMHVFQWTSDHALPICIIWNVLMHPTGLWFVWYWTTVDRNSEWWVSFGSSVWQIHSLRNKDQ